MLPWGVVITMDKPVNELIRPAMYKSFGKTYFLIYFHLFEPKTEHWPQKIQKSTPIYNRGSVSLCIWDSLGGLVCIHVLITKINRKVASFWSCDIVQLVICGRFLLILYISTHFFVLVLKEIHTIYTFSIHSIWSSYEKLYVSIKLSVSSTGFH